MNTSTLLKVGSKVRIIAPGDWHTNDYGQIIEVREDKLLCYRIRLYGGGVTFYYKDNEVALTESAD